MPEFIHQLRYATCANLTVAEAVMLAGLGLTAVLVRKKWNWTPTAYSIFLIFYITLLRRAPGYRENTLLLLRLQPILGIWVGNILNLILYVPFGWVAQQWKRSSKAVILAGLCLSVFCEVMQYLTARGQADANDILFNTLGAALGVWLAKWIARRL